MSEVSLLKTNSFSPVKIEADEVEILHNQPELKTDDLQSLKRRVLIGIHAYGLHDYSRIATFCGIPINKFKELLNDAEIQKALSEKAIPCWTKEELIARLCVECETATRPSDRILAITKLMEYRGLTAPEGGSRSFSRTVLRFMKPTV